MKATGAETSMTSSVSAEDRASKQSSPIITGRAERVPSRSQLLDKVWGDHVFIEERTVDVHIRRLRKSLEPTGHDRLIETVRGAGYRFSANPV